MNIAVCDDLPEYREKLKELLSPYIASNNLDIAEFSRGEDLLASCEEGKSWDIVFLDIEMDGLTGIETGKRLRKLQRDMIVIFVTSHVSYVSDAFRQDAFQFLLKPVQEEDFRKDFERALRVWKNRRRRYLVKWRNTSNMLEYRSILYLEAYHRHIFVHTSDEDYECVGKLQEEFAKAMGVSRQTISSLERGRYNPSILLAYHIAKYFDMTIEEVFLFEEDPEGGI